MRYSHHDIFAVHVVHRSDAKPELRGDLELVDTELGNTLDIAASPALLSAYEKAFDEFCEHLAAYCARYRLGYVRTDTDVPFEDVILQVFRQKRFLA